MEKRRVSAALHEHLTHLGGMKPADKIIERVYEGLGPGGILGLTHFGNDWYRRMAESPSKYTKINLENAFYVPEKDNLVFVNAQEVLARTKEGEQLHFLALAHNDDIRLRNGRTVEYSINEAKDNGAIIGLAHPFSSFGAGPYLEKNPELIELIDFMEIYNHLSGFWIPPMSMFPNKKAERIYQEWKKINPDLGSVISGDGHSLSQVGDNCIKIPELDLRNSDALRESLRYGIKLKREPSDEKKGGIISSYYRGLIHTFIAAVANCSKSLRSRAEIHFDH